MWHGLESFQLRSQLRWAGHVMRTSDDRIPKMLLFSQLSYGNRNVGRPWLRYKDKLKSNLKATNIPPAALENSFNIAQHGETSASKASRNSKVTTDMNKPGSRIAVISAWIVKRNG